MKLDEFKRNTDLYSADLSRWPVTLVRPALELVENDREAAVYFEEALALDAALRLETAPGMDVGALEARIMKAIDAPSARPPAASHAGRRTAIGAVFAVLLLAVFVELPSPRLIAVHDAALPAADQMADLPADVLADIGGPDDPDFWEEY